MLDNTGEGQITPLINNPPSETVYDQTEELEYIPHCSIPLSRYAKVVRYEEAAFWGVVTENRWQRGCGPLWAEGDRMLIEMALAQAQEQIELFIGYPLCKTYVSGTLEEAFNHDERWVDQRWYKPSRQMVVRYPRLIEAGVRKVDVVASSSLLTFGDTVATVGPLSVTFTKPEEVQVYYPDSGKRITPSKVTISAGNLTIQIPRYRLVAPDFLNTPEGGIMYEDLSQFLSAVDVNRVYTDPSVHGVLVRPNCSNNNCSGGCTECTHSACIYIIDPQIGQVQVSPALWNVSTESWGGQVVCAGNYVLARLNYACGLRYLSPEMEKILVSLAHTKLYGPPCSCDSLVSLWKYDNEIPRMLTRERINCPFGTANGAWNAYLWAKKYASHRASIL